MQYKPCYLKKFLKNSWQCRLNDVPEISLLYCGLTMVHWLEWVFLPIGEVGQVGQFHAEDVGLQCMYRTLLIFLVDEEWW